MQEPGHACYHHEKTEVFDVTLIVTLYLVSMLDVTIFPWKVLNVTIHRNIDPFVLFLDIECLMFQMLFIVQ